MSEIVQAVRRDLIQNADPGTKATGQNFFKEKITLHGVKTATVTKIGKAHFKTLPDRSKETVFALCEEMWQSGYMEETFIACNWAYALRQEFLPADFAVFEKWVAEYVSNWASCDSLCNHTIGAFIEMYPEYITRLKEWAKSDNRWVRRAAAVTLILPARRGIFLADVFEIADILMLDRDDLVRKGYGWMLKEASRQHQQEVFDYVVSHRAVMPRTALRYAIEKMTPELRAEAMKK